MARFDQNANVNDFSVGQIVFETYTEGWSLFLLPIGILQASTLKTIPYVYIEHSMKLKALAKFRRQHAVRKVGGC